MHQSNNKITLWISGNQFRSAGFQPIIAIGQFMLQLTYQGYPGMDVTPYYYVVKTTPEYTQYTLIHNKITSADGVSGTMLKMAVAIPAGYQLQNGISVLTLLEEIREVFTMRYMEPTLGVEGGFTYKRETPNKKDFEDILARYALEPTYIPLCITGGSRSGLLLASGEQMELLFQDVQYKEFQQFSEIIVSNDADTSYYEGCIINKLNNGKGITIPQERNFRLLINNVEKRWPVTDPYNEPTRISHTKVHNLDTNMYEEEITSFTINDLLNGMGPSNVSVDFNNSVVNCIINKPRRITKPLREPRPTVLKLSIRLVNCPIKKASIPATLVIDNGTNVPRHYPINFVQKNGQYYCETIIDSQLAGNDVKIDIVSDGNLEMTSPIERRLNESTNSIRIDYERHFKTSSNFANTINRNKKPILGVGIAIIAALIAGIIYLGVKPKEEKQLVADPVPKHNNEIPSKKDTKRLSMAEFVKESEEALEVDSLTFATVDKIFHDYQSRRDGEEYNKADENSKMKFDKFGEKIAMYDTLVTIIKNRASAEGSFDTFKKFTNTEGRKEYDSYKALVNECHKKYIKYVFNGKTGVCTWNVSGRSKSLYQKARLAFADPSIGIEKFMDFEKIVDAVNNSKDEPYSSSKTAPAPTPVIPTPDSKKSETKPVIPTPDSKKSETEPNGENSTIDRLNPENWQK